MHHKANSGRRKARRFLSSVIRTFTNQSLDFSERYDEKKGSTNTSKILTRSSHSDRRALKSALVLRSLIVGPSNAAPQLTKPVAMLTPPQLNKVKSQLLKPFSANKIIAQLRSLSTSDSSTIFKNESNEPSPINAVCFAHSDDEVNKVHFSNLFQGGDESNVWSLNVQGHSSATLEKLSALLNDMRIINLIQSPDIGFGQRADKPGLLTGSVPTPETVLQGIQKFTPQLIALLYASDQAIQRNHSGIYPPKDRLSVLTYWWGFELVLPPPSLAYLSRVQSIPNTIINFLTALSLMNNGVREILPFIRYIAQFIEFQFKSILAQDQGKGVVCAATWIMPTAMIPRPWDFSDPPEPKKVPATIIPQPREEPQSLGNHPTNTHEYAIIPSSLPLQSS